MLIHRTPTGTKSRRSRGTDAGTSALQRSASSSAGVTKLADLQRQADARSDADVSVSQPIQRKVVIKSDINTNLNRTHSNTRKGYFRTPLISALEQEFATMGGEPARGWKDAVWKMENDQNSTYVYDDVAELANALIEERPRKSGSQ